VTNHLVSVNLRLWQDLSAPPVIVDLIWAVTGETHDTGVTQHDVSHINFIEIAYGVEATGVIGYDTDGVPYFGTDIPDAVAVGVDTDGTPYLTS